MEDPIDSVWDELHPPGPRFDAEALRPFPEGAEVDPITEIDDLLLTPEAHLVLAWTWADLGRAIDRLRAKTHPRATVDKLTSHLPCLIYGNEHWLAIQTALLGDDDKGIEGLLPRKRQAFIGTMNTFVVDCFYFESREDVQEKLLFVSTSSARLYRLTEDRADDFYVAYKTGIQHTSEILRTEGIW